MICPLCQSPLLAVTNSRPTRKYTQIWRRRICQDCGSQFTTYEKFDLSFLKVIKKSGKRVYYSRAKLFSSLYHAVISRKGVDRGDAGIEAEKLTEKIETQIIKSSRKEISTSAIVDLVIKTLKHNHYDVLLRYIAYFRGDDPSYLTKTFSLR